MSEQTIDNKHLSLEERIAMGKGMRKQVLRIADDLSQRPHLL